MKRFICFLLIGSVLSVSVGPVFGERKGVALAPVVSQNLNLLEAWIKAKIAYEGLPG